ncbi:MAG TPA: DNA-3-methyladenine glycosylase I [Dongiaceae bacterium]|jgi:DNA-3-methyladenine glycosylase I|nr:DNA-3-methyladenine glycosylase I [Dongiaceae bacterium]
MSTYCAVAPGHEWHGPYHESQYGFPIADDDLLFERLILEINQAGLSWLTILKRQDAFRQAFRDFRIDKVARLGARDVERLMQDASIIRNRLKIEATIENAKRIKAIQREAGSFAAWLKSHHPKRKDEWVKLFKKTFVFTGGEIVGEFLMSIGYLPGAHATDCPIYKRIAKLKPAWIEAERKGFSYSEG